MLTHGGNHLSHNEMLSHLTDVQGEGCVVEKACNPVTWAEVITLLAMAQVSLGLHR